jgi:hypothetical protein
VIGLLDVVRSAASEIADFPRVELVGIDERISVSGRAVSDVSHLLAELLENATSFSSPDTAVVVSGAITKSGFVLALTDQGIGMTPERIAEANTLLRHPPVVGLALSRALGLHVVGALAKRHGIAVEIRKAAPVGTVALVALPKAILEARGRDEGSPMAPVYAPDIDDDGSAVPLGARRAGPASAGAAPVPSGAATATAVTWHPADEPPVEQWAREVDAQQHVDAAVASAAAEALVAEPVEAPVAEPVEQEPVAEALVEEPVAEALVEEPVAESPRFEMPTFEAPRFEEEPVVDEAPPFDDLPLPTRIPGQNMTHQPVVDEEDPLDDADPMRPYRVHELLTRHSQGVQRGQEHHDTDDPGSSFEPGFDNGFDATFGFDLPHQPDAGRAGEDQS